MSSFPWSVCATARDYVMIDPVQEVTGSKFPCVVYDGIKSTEVRSTICVILHNNHYIGDEV